MERDPTHPPQARGDRARHWLALVADAAFLVASLFLLYTALGGEVRWRTALFRITLTDTNRPTQVCVLASAHQGGPRPRPVSSPPSRPRAFRSSDPSPPYLHALDVRLRAVFLAYRLPLLVSATSLFVSLGLLELYLRHFPHTLPTPSQPPHHAISHRPVLDLPAAGVPDHLDASERRATHRLQRIPVASQDGLAGFSIRRGSHGQRRPPGGFHRLRARRRGGLDNPSSPRVIPGPAGGQPRHPGHLDP